VRPDLLLVDRQCTFRDAPHLGYQTHSHAAIRDVRDQQLMLTVPDGVIAVLLAGARFDAELVAL
jgi:hypothetical protein